MTARAGVLSLGPAVFPDDIHQTSRPGGYSPNEKENVEGSSEAVQIRRKKRKNIRDFCVKNR